jgi:hypothetical protein
MTEDIDIRTWVGQYGNYVVPERFDSVKISKSTGWPDMRCKGATDMLQWAAETDAEYGKHIEKAFACA